MKPDVSVIVPVYNGSNSINISLDSLLNQTYANFEVIIIDDGSIDDSREKINQYTNKDNRFIYFFQENQGVSAARNKGIELASGKYVCFLDSDDFFERTYIKKMVDKIKLEKADICYCGKNDITPTSKKVSKMIFTSENLLIKYILGKVRIHTTGWMIQKKMIEKYDLKFPVGISWGEDFEFFCEILRKSKKVTFVDEYLTNYRINFEPDRLSAFSIEKLDEDFEMIQRILNNQEINSQPKIEKALNEYRLQSLIIYRLLLGIDEGVENKIILNYFNKYKIYLNKISWINGFRSLKLNISKIKLCNKVNLIRKLKIL